MARRINQLSSYNPTSADAFLLDTNILINLFYPIDFDDRNKPYEDYYKKIISTKCTLVLTSIQVSEFINRCIRIQHNLYKNDHPEAVDFKRDYRVTQNYSTAMKAILQILKTITTKFTIVDDSFSKMDIEKLINHNFSFDFNDSFLMAYAELHNLIILTDDCDFANYPSSVKIITNNQRLLRFS